MITVTPKPVSLEDVMKDKTFEVPLYQREYSWEIDEVSDLYYDLENLGEDDSHFMGTLLFAEKRNNSKEHEIIDGQQRLITLFLLIRGIRIVIERKNGKTSDIDKLVYDKETTYGPDDHSQSIPRITASKRDRDYFKSIMVDTNILKGKKIKSHQCLSKAFDFLIGKIEKRVEDYGLKQLYGFMNKVAKRVVFITMTGEENSDKVLFFKTLNARGLELSKSDLVKNELCHNLKGGIQIDQAVDKWDSIRDELERVGVNADNFLFHYINSLSQAQLLRIELDKKKEGKPDVEKQKQFFVPPIPEKALFDAYELSLKKVERTDDFLRELEESSTHYTGFVAPDSELEALRALREFNIVRCFPLLLHCKRVLKEDSSFSRIANAIEVLSFQHSTICQKDAKELERFYYQMQMKLKSDEDVENVILEFRKQLPIQDYFESSFLFASPKTSISKYILFRICAHLDIPLDYKARNIHIEHIMPKTPAGEWLKLKEISEEFYDDYLNRLGNLTLLQGRKNQVISNKDFKDKKVIYSKPGNPSITLDLTNYVEWNFESIATRQKSLFAYVKEIWGTIK